MNIDMFSLSELRGTLGFQIQFYTCVAMATRKHFLDVNAGAHKDFRWLRWDPQGTGSIHCWAGIAGHTWISDLFLHVLSHRG